MANCLVTGGAGFIGSHVTDFLIGRGHDVTVVDNLSTGNVNNLNDNALFYERDIRDKAFINSLKHYDYVFHLASLARIQPSIDDPITSNDVNLNGTLNILEYCRQNKSKLIFSSSSSIYAESDKPTTEAHKKYPKSPYSLQKMICENYINLYRDLYGLESCILRYFNVYGERQILDGAYAAVVGIFLDQKAKGQKLTITGNGKQKRDFTYVKDVAKANLMAIGWEGTFNIGTGSNHSILDIAHMVKGEIEFLPKRQGEVMSTLADNTKAKDKGWKPNMAIWNWVTMQ